MREAGTGAAGAEAWREAGRALRERARLAWALGAALEEALATEAPCGEGAVATLEAIVARALAGPGASLERVAQPTGESGQSVAAHQRRQPTLISDAQTAWRQMQATDLVGRSMPVVWFASAGAGGGEAASRPTLRGGERATLALGATADGGKAVLGVWAGGAAEHRCSERVAVAAAVRALWGDVAVVARCRVHKRRNVLKQLPKSEHRWVARALEQAWRHQDADEANTYLDELIKELEPKWPAAAASLREGLAQTLTCQRLGLPPELLRALGSTNLIEIAFRVRPHRIHLPPPLPVADRLAVHAMVAQWP